ncbi:sigma-70 family RNA polymerase sigma factor [Svornostia abyssi]|jgi:RNA polymerase sigma factor (sigma-70 family)|uniref:Sigma-70 family RNA polymerase sigma factor n=1 Tax=Svornostia abyssi TaxID=2898438 RepID=A0ABY5PKS1_9ACTN|nr:sigma-70 family RNA polymerase sigma factor [Parviterribacteraceae bacterium J379]
MQPRPASTAAAAHGDEEDLFRQHHAELSRAVRQVVNASPELIEDACQMAWITLLRNQPRRDSVFGWLRKVAINEAYRLSGIERRGVRLDLLPGDRQSAACAVFDLDDSLQAREVLRALGSLPAKQRRDYALHAAGFTYAEIAELTNRTRTNVDKTLDKARARMRLERLRAYPGERGAK